MINMQSDVVNMPTDAMWEAMRSATPGWVIAREDPSVNRLESLAASMMGKEAALYIPTGRMACLVALMTYCRRGHQVIMERNSHIVWGQELGITYICGAYPRLIDSCAGVMDPEAVESAITESRFKHAPRTDLVCIENTHNMSGGRVVSPAQTSAFCEVAHRHDARVFIDGARILHAAIALGVKPAELVAEADGVMFSLVKGLSAPAGVMLCGSTVAMREAYENLGRIGGHSLHKAGIFAAAGIVALETMVDRLRDDQLRARKFATAVSKIQGVSVDQAGVETNIVMVDISGSTLESGEFLKRIEELGLKAGQYTESVARFTFHRHITDVDIETAVKIIQKVTSDKSTIGEA